MKQRAWLLALALGCTRSPPPPVLDAGPPIVERVGPYVITEADLVLRAKVIEQYYPTSHAGRAEALGQLRLGYLKALLLQKYDAGLDDAALRAEAARIDRETLAPEKLARLKQVFSSHDDYLRLFVLPDLADRDLYAEVFLSSPQVQAAAWDRARTLLEAARGTKRFSELPSAQSNLVFTVEASAADGISADLEGTEPTMNTAPPAEAKRWLEATRLLAPGEVWSEIVDVTESLWVVRVLGPGRTPGTRRFEVLMVPKEDYGSWLEREKAAVLGAQKAR